MSEEIEQEEVPAEELESQEIEEIGEEVAEEEGGGEDEIVISVEGDEPPQEEEEQARAPNWVKDLRSQAREQKKRIRELEDKLREKEQPQAVKLPEKPTLEGCDYDPERYEQELEAWYGKKREHDAEQAKASAAQEAAQKSWNNKIENYNNQRESMKVGDFEDAEATVNESLSPAQIAIIVNGASNPAHVIYAIGKDPKRAKEFGEMTDLVQFAFRVSKLEDKITVSTRRAPPPEKTISGSAPKSGAVDSNLARLRAEAEKTGNYSKVVAYNKQQREKGRKA